MKSIKFFFILIILALLAGLSGQFVSAQTQPEIRLNVVNLHLLPEFNQPSVLVIFEINLNESLSLPYELIFEVPTDAQIINVINFTPEDRPVELAYQESRIGIWKDLRFTSTSHRIRIEYQDPNLIRQGVQRMYEFQWLSKYPVEALSVMLRQPLGASEIDSQPSLSKSEDAQQGTLYYSADLGAVPAGELFTISLAYTKDPGELAFPALPVEPAMPIDENAPGRTPSPINVIMWLLIASVAIIVIVGLYHLWVRANLADKRKRVVQGVGILNPEKQIYFCHECGMRSRLGDRFCSNCGTQLRKPTPIDHPPAV